VKRSASLMADRLQARRYQLIFCLICFGIALTFGLLVTQSGPGISPDSIQYIKVGEAIYQGHGFPSDYAHYPLYPLLIAGFMHLGFGGESAARLIPVLCFALLVFPVFSLGKMIGGTLVGYASCLACLVCTPLLVVTSYALTDMPLVLLGISAILFLVKFATSYEASTKWLLLSALLTAAAILMHLGGLILIGVGLIVILVKNKWRIRRSALQISLFLAISCLPAVPWFVRNKIVTSHWTQPLGIQGSISYSATPRVVHWIGITVLPYVLPYRSSRVMRDTYAQFGFDFHHYIFIVGAILGALFILWLISIILVAIQLKHKGVFSTYLRRNYVPIIYILVHLVGLIVASAIWGLDYEDRYLSLLYPLIAIVTISLVFHAYRTIRSSSPRLPLFLVIGLSCVYLFGLQAASSAGFYQIAKHGQGYNSEFWRNSQAIAYVKSNLLDNAPVYTNCVMPMSVRVENPISLPGSEDEKGIEAFFETVRNEEDALVIGFKQTCVPGLITNDEIIAREAQYHVLVPAADFPEATIWSIRPQ